MITLTKAEEQVMQVLWKLKQGFLKDLMEAMPEPKPHSNTVATMLKILIDKGFVEYETHGRNNLYKPLISKTDYSKKTIQHYLKAYFEGSPAKLVSQFINDKKISQEELEALLKQIRNSKNI